ncbi:hypothetical protein D3C86_2150330 [compost metagenome]
MRLVDGGEVTLPDATSSIEYDFHGRKVTLGNLAAHSKFRLKAEVQDSLNVTKATASIDLDVTDDNALAATLSIAVPYEEP